VAVSRAWLKPSSSLIRRISPLNSGIQDPVRSSRPLHLDVPEQELFERTPPLRRWAEHHGIREKRSWHRRNYNDLEMLEFPDLQWIMGKHPKS